MTNYRADSSVVVGVRDYSGLHGFVKKGSMADCSTLYLLRLGPYPRREATVSSFGSSYCLTNYSFSLDSKELNVNEAGAEAK